MICCGLDDTYKQVLCIKELSFPLEIWAGLVQTLLLTSCVILDMSLSISEPAPGGKVEMNVAATTMRREPVVEGDESPHLSLGTVVLIFSPDLSLDCGCSCVHLHCPTRMGCQDKTTSVYCWGS